MKTMKKIVCALMTLLLLLSSVPAVFADEADTKTIDQDAACSLTIWKFDYGRFFKMFMYTAIAPIPLSTFAGEPTQSIGKSFLKSYASVCLEGAVIVLACVIFSAFASSPPVVDAGAAAATMVWSYIGELIFNMLILVGSVKMADRVVREMMGL